MQGPAGARVRLKQLYTSRPSMSSRLIRPLRIRLDIAGHGQKVLVLLPGKRHKTLLEAKLESANACASHWRTAPAAAIARGLLPAHALGFIVCGFAKQREAVIGPMEEVVHKSVSAHGRQV